MPDVLCMLHSDELFPKKCKRAFALNVLFLFKQRVKMSTDNYRHSRSAEDES